MHKGVSILVKHFDHQVLRCLLNEIDRGHGFRLVDIQLPLTQNDIFDALRRRIGTYKKSVRYLSVILAFTFQLLRDSEWYPWRGHRCRAEDASIVRRRELVFI